MCINSNGAAFVFIQFLLLFFPGAVYLEGGLEEARQLFGRLLFNGGVSFNYIDLKKIKSAVICFYFSFPKLGLFQVLKYKNKINGFFFLPI